MAILCSAQFGCLLIPSLSCSLSGGFPFKMQRKGRSRRLTHLDKSLSVCSPLDPNLCFALIAFRSLSLAESFFIFIYILLFCFSSAFHISPSHVLSSPSHPSCLLQLPPIIPPLSFSPSHDMWVCTQVASQSFIFTSGLRFMRAQTRGGGAGEPKTLQEPYSNLISHC